MMGKSAVIIGGGLGGLFTGAILSKEGVEVTIVEKNATVGGGLQSFTRFGEVYDTGMHVVGGLQEGGNIRRICEYLGIMDKVMVKKVDPDVSDRLYFAEDKKFYTVSCGREQYVESLAKDFPDQRENLKAYVDAMFRISDELELFKLKPSSDFLEMHSEDFSLSATAFIAKYISDERLRNIVAYTNPLYGGVGDQTPAYIHAIISVVYISGTSRFAGGTYRFAELLKDVILENGGQVIVSDGVAHITSEGKMITGVVTKKGRTFTADHYICAIHPCSLFKLLDDPTVLPKAYRSRLESIPNTYSCFTLNLKLKPGTFPYINHSEFYMSRYDEIWNFGNKDKQWPLGFLYMTPPEIGQGEYSTKMIITAPMVWDEVKQWEDTYVGHRGEEYEQWKEEHAEILIRKMEELYPDFRNCIEAVNTASPLTIRDYYGVKEGSMCGFSKDYANMALSHVPIATKVGNLLLTGQNCILHGFCGVPLTALVTSEAILGRNYLMNKLCGQ